MIYSALVIYLDHNATTPLDQRVCQQMVNFMQDPSMFGNPASIHQIGQKARAQVEKARQAVAYAVHAEPLEVTFTAGGTEADNFAIFAAIAALQGQGKPYGILISPLEHPAVLAPCQQLALQGVPLMFLPVDRAGRIDPQDLAAVLNKHPEIGFVSLAAANHELGNTYPIPALVEAVRSSRPDALVHCDAVQALGKIVIDFHAWDVDLLSLSAHKIYGPKGVGALVHRRHLALKPHLFGGSQERGFRPGTEAVINIVGFGWAASLASEELTTRYEHCNKLRSQLLQGFASMADVTIYGDPQHHIGTTVSVGFHGVDAQLLLMNLDLAGIAVSTGSACTSGSLEPSKVLLALGLEPAKARSVLRISLGKDTKEPEIRQFLAILPDLCTRIKSVDEKAKQR